MALQPPKKKMFCFEIREDQVIKDDQARIDVASHENPNEFVEIRVGVQRAAAGIRKDAQATEDLKNVEALQQRLDEVVKEKGELEASNNELREAMDAAQEHITELEKKIKKGK